MAQMDLQHARELIVQLAENPDGPAARAISDRRMLLAVATVLARGGLLAPRDD